MNTVTNGQPGSRVEAEFGRCETKRLFLRCNMVAVGVPLLAFAIILSYSAFQNIMPTNRDWKMITFLLWVGALVALVRFFWESKPKRICPTVQTDSAEPKDAEK